MKTKDEVISTIEIALELEKGSLNIDTRMGSIEQWDSLGHLTILSSLDVLFDGLIGPISNISEAQSVEDILNILIENKLIDNELDILNRFPRKMIQHFIYTLHIGIVKIYHHFVWFIRLIFLLYQS